MPEAAAAAAAAGAARTPPCAPWRLTAPGAALCGGQGWVAGRKGWMGWKSHACAAKSLSQQRCTKAGLRGLTAWLAGGLRVERALIAGHAATGQSPVRASRWRQAQVCLRQQVRRCKAARQAAPRAPDAPVSRVPALGPLAALAVQALQLGAVPAEHARQHAHDGGGQPTRGRSLPHGVSTLC